MTLPRIAIASLGGTISMTPDAASGGVVPRLDAAQLIASVQALGDVAHISAESLFQLPSSALDTGHVYAALQWAEQQIDAGASGVVLTQGTDTIEETAFLADLYWRRAEPLVVVGAMRAPQSAGADGPANLLAGARVAADPASRERGVLVVLNDTVHAARWVRKRHSILVQAFASPETGPLGMTVEGRVRYFQPPHRWATPLPPVTHPHKRVALLQTWLGDDGQLAELAQQAGYDGLVIAGAGAGHLPFAYAERFDALCAAVPVVVAGRTGEGPTAHATYGYVGSEIDLARRGAILAGWLNPIKARLLLWALLASGTGRAELAQRWAQYDSH